MGDYGDKFAARREAKESLVRKRLMQNQRMMKKPIIHKQSDSDNDDAGKAKAKAKPKAAAKAKPKKPKAKSKDE